MVPGVHASLWFRWALWCLLALPAWGPLRDLWLQERYFAETMHVTGELSVKLLVLTLSITPLTLLLRRGYGNRNVAR